MTKSRSQRANVAVGQYRVFTFARGSVVIRAVAAYIDTARKEKRTVHAVGDGTFIVDGRKIDWKKLMAFKLPSGV